MLWLFFLPPSPLKETGGWLFSFPHLLLFIVVPFPLLKYIARFFPSSLSFSLHLSVLPASYWFLPKALR